VQPQPSHNFSFPNVCLCFAARPEDGNLFWQVYSGAAKGMRSLAQKKRAQYFTGDARGSFRLPMYMRQGSVGTLINVGPFLTNQTKQTLCLNAVNNTLYIRPKHARYIPRTEIAFFQEPVFWGYGNHKKGIFKHPIDNFLRCA
jgi:hypothetical protein